MAFVLVSRCSSVNGQVCPRISPYSSPISTKHRHRAAMICPSFNPCPQQPDPPSSIILQSAADSSSLRVSFITVEVRKKMKSATIGLCLVSTVAAIAVSITTSVDSLEQDPLMMCLALALCMAFNGGIALIVRGVRRP